MDYKGGQKPTVFTFTYSVDKAQFNKWLVDNPCLTEGILSFVGKGIEITVPPGENKVNKSGFSVDGPNGERQWLPILQHPITFKVQRDVFGGNEWVCLYVE